MKNEDKLLDVIGEVDEDLIRDLSSEMKADETVSSKEAGKVSPRIRPVKRKKVIWISAAAGLLAAAVLIYFVSPLSRYFGRKGKQEPAESTDVLSAYIMASPLFPVIPSNPDIGSDEAGWQYDENAEKEYREALRKLREQPQGYHDGYDAYCSEVLPALFSNTGDSNLVFSPLGLYLALSMTAEITDGSSREQILDLLHQPDIDTARSHARSIWLANYMDDGLSKLVLGNSLWTNSKWEYDRDVMDILAKDYYAYSYSGDPSSDEYSQELGKWIDLMTDDLLSGMTDGLKLDPRMVLALASTVNYYGQWEMPFESSLTKQGTFHAPSGDVTCDFMNTDMAYKSYYGDHFTSVELDLINNGSMRFILPEEGMAPEDLLKDEEVLRFLNSAIWDNSNESGSIHLSVPKFDISSEIDLDGYLMDLGITDVFDETLSDFSPICKDAKGLSISSVKQDTRVMIDETGCKAASVTLVLAGAGVPEVVKEMVLDRPFVFEIMSETGLPLFVGIVNNPS